MTAPAVPDLGARILTAIEETKRTAREAMQTNTGRWTSGSPYGYGTVVQDDAGQLVVYLNRGLNGRAAYIARNDPESVLRRCVADRKIVAEVCGLSSGVPKDELAASLGDLVLGSLAEGYGVANEETDDECE
jgi:hypothetical protein